MMRSTITKVTRTLINKPSVKKPIQPVVNNKLAYSDFLKIYKWKNVR